MRCSHKVINVHVPCSQLQSAELNLHHSWDNLVMPSSFCAPACCSSVVNDVLNPEDKSGWRGSLQHDSSPQPVKLSGADCAYTGQPVKLCECSSVKKDPTSQTTFSGYINDVKYIQESGRKQEFLHSFLPSVLCCLTDSWHAGYISSRHWKWAWYVGHNEPPAACLSSNVNRHTIGPTK